MLLAALVLTIPNTSPAAEQDGRAGVVAAPAITTGAQAAVSQRRGGWQNRRGNPPQARGSQRGRGNAKGYDRGNGRYDRNWRPAPRPPAGYPYRAPARYRAPRYDVRRTYLGRTGVSLSFLYSATWGDVYVEFGNPVPPNAYVIPAPIAAPPPPYLRTRYSVRIPPGHLPPPGFCRIWYPGRPPGHQPPPTDCATAYWYAPQGSYIVYGG
jgi:hypothetical protein